jgi:hypothetical protein
MPSIGQTWVLASIGAVVEMGVLSTLKRLHMESTRISNSVPKLTSYNLIGLIDSLLIILIDRWSSSLKLKILEHKYVEKYGVECFGFRFSFFNLLIFSDYLNCRLSLTV